MKIALLSPLEESVPPEKYGGTELVIFNLAETLVKRGHEVHLLATGDSKTSGVLHSILPRAIRKENYAEDLSARRSIKYISMGKILEILTSIDLDVIHNHIGYNFVPFSKVAGAPVVTNLHGPLDVPGHDFIYKLFLGHQYITISDSQREPMPDLNYAATVYNGIDLELFDFSEKQGDYLAFLGRMSPEKGPKQAIEAARAFGMKLKMAAKVDAVDREYFAKEIEPMIDGDDVEFIGEVGPEGKNELLKGAYALLGPIQWREPFGLFMIEAMACGTPVVVTNMGSAPEVVEDGVTGFVVENTTETFTAALKKVPEISRRACRERTEKLFSKEKMTDDYIKVYEKIIKSNRI